ncbi:unnamed protein product [Protopolystoma xenopodis]|uniref:Uncharacterized protein n=1 Tax=Protopolystoma xenopodis TaxID=117903 RepID=A0A448XHA3_9PLAT|nr:unnamed protein product [Protopolystoma xenopodis]
MSVFLVINPSLETFSGSTEQDQMCLCNLCLLLRLDSICPATNLPFFVSFYQGFGFGVMILDGFKIAERWEHTDEDNSNYSILWIPKHLVHFLYIFWQTYFIFKYHRIVFNVQKFFLRFLLSHMAVANLCQWLKTVVEEITAERAHDSETPHFEGLHPPASGSAGHPKTHSEWHLPSNLHHTQPSSMLEAASVTAVNSPSNHLGKQSVI